jgi:hypothetical protein
MSSPAAALAALESRHTALAGNDEDEPDFRPFVFESTDERTDDQPTPPVEAAEATLADADRRRLRELGRLAQALLNSADDTKLGGCAKLVGNLLRGGFNPIIWCRYIATAEYLADALQKALGRAHAGLRVVAITGRLGDDERRAKVQELAQHAKRLLVATDCLSEGVNLQREFNAVLHYDLPWNPNRLEQREGRVDRFGQPSKEVKAIRYYSPESAVDGVVLEVLLNKAREIHRALGTHVPVPDDSETVTEALVNALFLRRRSVAEDGIKQLELDFGECDVDDFHRRWDLDAEREKLNRTRFAQRALKPAEVRQEMEATDAVLGDPDAVREFLLSAAQRIGLHVEGDRDTGVYIVQVGETARCALPEAVQFALPVSRDGEWRITFRSPPPEHAKDAEYVGRNHSFVSALAGFLLEQALTGGGAAAAARCGVIRTRAVSRLTTILLLRVRYLVEQRERAPLLSEEVVVLGHTSSAKHGTRTWLEDDEAYRLLAEAKPDANVPLPEKRELIQTTLDDWPALADDLHKRIAARASELEKSHKRVRQAVSAKTRSLTVVPQLPPDLLGILVLQPVVS